LRAGAVGNQSIIIVDNTHLSITIIEAVGNQPNDHHRRAIAGKLIIIIVENRLSTKIVTVGNLVIAIHLGVILKTRNHRSTIIVLVGDQNRITMKIGANLPIRQQMRLLPTIGWICAIRRAICAGTNDLKRRCNATRSILRMTTIHHQCMTIIHHHCSSIVDRDQLSDCDFVVLDRCASLYES
jgi:hypothetical protein